MKLILFILLSLNISSWASPYVLRLPQWKAAKTIWPMMKSLQVVSEKKAIFRAELAHLPTTFQAQKLYLYDQGALFFSLRRTQVEAHFFIGFEPQELKRLLKLSCDLDKKTSFFSIISSAHAENCEEQRPLIPLSSDLGDLHDALSFESTALKTFSPALKACGQGLLTGVWEATGGVVTDLYDILKNPNQALKELKENYLQLQKMLAHLDQSLNEFKEAYQELETQEKSQILCQLISTVGTSLVVINLSSGLALPQSLLKVSLILKNSSSPKLVLLGERMEKSAREKIDLLQTIRRTKEGQILAEKTEELTKLKTRRLEIESITAKNPNYELVTATQKKYSIKFSMDEIIDLPRSGMSIKEFKSLDFAMTHLNDVDLPLNLYRQKALLDLEMKALRELAQKAHRDQSFDVHLKHHFKRTEKDFKKFFSEVDMNRLKLKNEDQYIPLSTKTKKVAEYDQAIRENFPNHQQIEAKERELKQALVDWKKAQRPDPKSVALVSSYVGLTLN